MPEAQTQTEHLEVLFEEVVKDLERNNASGAFLKIYEAREAYAHSTLPSVRDELRYFFCEVLKLPNLGERLTLVVESSLMPLNTSDDTMEDTKLEGDGHTT